MTAGRGGFTLVEILVATAIGSLIFAAAITLFNYSNRSQGVTASARALQTATLIEEHVTDDLRRLVDGKGGAIRFDDNRPSTLSFYACDPAAPRSTLIQVMAVRYFMEEQPGYLKREWNARIESVGVSPLTSIQFFPFMSATGPLVRVNMAVGRDPTDPPGPPIVHTFLARIATSGSLPVIGRRIVTDFRDPRDAPQGQRLPAP